MVQGLVSALWTSTTTKITQLTTPHEGLFRDNERNNFANKHSSFKNPNWQEANQLAIYKHDQGVELGSSENNSS